MLFPYTYVPHQMETMQEFIDFIFFKVWCKAPKHKGSYFELLDGYPDLKEVMKSFHNDHTKGGDFFNSHVERIYDLFSKLSPDQIDTFKQWYQANNNIEQICANDPTVNIVRYSDIETSFPALSRQLESFFKGLYSQKLLDLKALRDKIGEISDHYHQFMNINDKGKCPFCGITDVLGVYHTKREAYDHYLPQGIYPFNSINFRNLVPTCHYCNSSYKISKDIAYTLKDPAGNKQRRKVFYPFSATFQEVEIQIDFSQNNIEHLTPNDIQLSFGPNVISEEIETWKDVYSIEERYKAKCCSSDGGKYWLEEMRLHCDAHGIEPKAELAYRQQLSKKFPMADNNFLRVAFLKECFRKGLFSDS